jgi:arylsulfatase A-like enzyme
MKTTLYSLSTILVASLYVSGCNTSNVQKEQPNVLFIISDDLNDWIGPYGGHPQAKTPNLDKFATSGAMTMMNAQCAATVCGPSRSALLSGLRPSTTGVYGNVQNIRFSEAAAGLPTMPQHFSRNGYFTLSTGKIFHKHDVPGEGRDHGQWAFDLWENTGGKYEIDMDKFPLSGLPSIEGRERIGVRLDWGATLTEKEETGDWKSAEWAAKKIEEGFDKPFFLMLGISKPHLTWYLPQEYFDRYDLESIIVPEINEADLEDILTPDGKRKFESSGDYDIIKEHDKFKEATRAYLACVSYVDDCVGLVLDALENSEYKDNTIVVFIGDHGWFLGEKLRYRKTHLWEESCRTPMLIKLPGKKEPVKITRPVSFMDIYPTLAELCNIPVPEHIEGRSIVPLLENPEKEWYPAVTTMGYNNHSVRSDRYRYNIWSDGTEELYDHETDPMEWKNLINDPAYTDIIAELKTHLPLINVKEFATINQ